MSKPLRYIPAIPGVAVGMNNVTSLTQTILAMKEAVEILAGHRGADLDRAVTLRDLIQLGLISEADVKELD